MANRRNTKKKRRNDTGISQRAAFLKMVFSIQRYIEDYLSRRGIEDIDQYAVRLANLYDVNRAFAGEEGFLRRMRRLRTILFKNHARLDRDEFERNLLSRLDDKFRTKTNPHPGPSIVFPGGVEPERRSLTKQRRSIAAVLAAFKNAVEARGIDGFWESRQKAELHSRPEKIGQVLLAVFARGVLSNRGLVLRELHSGVGFVDLAIVIGSTPHLIEIKILKGRLQGTGQLGSYMRTESRKQGWLMLFDTRRAAKKTAIPEKIMIPDGTINVMVVDINPIPPSKKSN